jgi:hypothetical protein
MKPDLKKVEDIVMLIKQSNVIDKILETMDHGFGEVNFKLTIQNGKIVFVALTDTKTTKFD